MPFEPVWVEESAQQFRRLQTAAETALNNRRGQGKASKQEGLFKQVEKTIRLLLSNPRHPGLHTHPYDSLPHPYDPRQKVFEAYAQNKTPGAYRVFWCYGPQKTQITVIAITRHP